VLLAQRALVISVVDLLATEGYDLDSPPTLFITVHHCLSPVFIAFLPVMNGDEW